MYFSHNFLRNFRAAFCIWSLAFISAFAGKGTVSSVETVVDLQDNGKARVTYMVQWKVTKGEFHGFYFGGNDRLEIQNFESPSYAYDSSNRRYGLSISPTDGLRWDIVLSDGQGVRSGTVTYVFSFITDFAQAKYLISTRSEKNEDLTAFDWSPVQWDEAFNQKHYSLTIVTPFKPKSTRKDSLEQYRRIILTEPWVNQRYLIDYQTSKDGRLSIRFHRNNPENLFHFRVQFYMPSEWFNGQLPQGNIDKPARLAQNFASAFDFNRINNIVLLNYQDSFLCSNYVQGTH